jgi:hypothetical protein
VAEAFPFARVAAALMFTSAIAAFACAALAQPSPTPSPELQITSPANNSTANPGQTLTITVNTLNGASFPNGISLWGSIPLGAAGVNTSGPPYTFSLTIPTTAPPGAYLITAIGNDSTGTTTGAQITIQVEPASTPTAINVQPSQVVLSAIGAAFPLLVIATFSDGSTEDVTDSANVSYTSANLAVTTASSTGVIMAVGPGTTAVDVEYAPGGGSLEVEEPVGVLNPVVSLSPPTLAFGAVLVDTSVPQTVTVTNSGDAPFSFLSISTGGYFSETDNCVFSPPTPIPVGGTCSVQVTFAPTTTGESASHRMFPVSRTHCVDFSVEHRHPEQNG